MKNKLVHELFVLVSVNKIEMLERLRQTACENKTVSFDKLINHEIKLIRNEMLNISDTTNNKNNLKIGRYEI